MPHDRLRYRVGDPSSYHKALLTGPREASSLCIFEQLMAEGTASYLSSLSSSRGFTAKDAYLVMGMRILLIGRGKKDLFLGEHIVLRQQATLLRLEILRDSSMVETRGSSNVPGGSSFMRILRNMLISPSLASSNMSKATLSLVQPGDYVSLDEKFAPFGGRSPISMVVPKKAKGAGHWVTEVATMMEGSELPVLLGTITHQVAAAVEGRGYTDRVMRWYLDLMESQSQKTVVCFDKYYNSGDVRQVLHARDVRYVGALNRRWSGGLYSLIVKHLKPDRSWCSFYNRTSGDVVTGFRTGENGDKVQLVMGDIMRPSRAGETFSGDPPLYTAYRHYFNACDMFNRCLSPFMWPYNRQGWKQHLDTLFFAMLLTNAYHIWLTSTGSLTTQQVTPAAFCDMLGWALVRKYVRGRKLN